MSYFFTCINHPAYSSNCPRASPFYVLFLSIAHEMNMPQQLTCPDKIHQEKITPQSPPASKWTNQVPSPCIWDDPPPTPGTLRRDIFIRHTCPAKQPMRTLHIILVSYESTPKYTWSGERVHAQYATMCISENPSGRQGGNVSKWYECSLTFAPWIVG